MQGFQGLRFRGVGFIWVWGFRVYRVSKGYYNGSMRVLRFRG